MRKYDRYQGSALTESFLDLKSKNMNSIKLPTNQSAMKNPQNDLLKLPSLNTTRRSASMVSTERNTKFKLQNLDQKIQELAVDVHNTRLQAGETLNQIRSLKESLAINQLNKNKQDLKKQIKGLERLVQATKIADQQRYQILRNDCIDLWSQTENLRQCLFQLRMRTDKLDRGMGFKDS